MNVATLVLVATTPSSVFHSSFFIQLTPIGDRDEIAKMAQLQVGRSERSERV